MPAITTAGIYPGTSNVMAAHLISLARKVWLRRLALNAKAGWPADRFIAPTPLRPWRQEYDDEGNYREPGPGAVEPRRLRFSYYTAGSGGVGPTIMATSMLLAGEPVVAFKDGVKVRPRRIKAHQG